MNLGYRTEDSHGMLLLAVLVIVVAWQVPYGPQALYPLTLLATFAHEMGHGLTALLAGCLLYTSPSPRDGLLSRMPSSA